MITAFTGSKKSSLSPKEENVFENQSTFIPITELVFKKPEKCPNVCFQLDPGEKYVYETSL